MVDQLSNVMHDLGISRFNFAKEIPAEFESLETMLDTLGKKKRHSLGTYWYRKNVVKTFEKFDQNSFGLDQSRNNLKTL